MPLLPKTPADWTRALVGPLFVACIGLSIVALVGPFQGFWFWHDFGTPIAGSLTVVGIVRGLTCVLGRDFDGPFKTWAMVAAVLSVVLGLLSFPALAV